MVALVDTLRFPWKKGVRPHLLKLHGSPSGLSSCIKSTCLPWVAYTKFIFFTMRPLERWSFKYDHQKWLPKDIWFSGSNRLYRNPISFRWMTRVDLASRNSGTFKELDDKKIRPSIGALLDFTHLSHLTKPPVETHTLTSGEIFPPEKAPVKHLPAWNLASFWLLLRSKALDSAATRCSSNRCHSPRLAHSANATRN